MIMEKDRICWTTIANTLKCYLVRPSNMFISYSSPTHFLRELGNWNMESHTGIIREFHMEKNLKL